PGRFGPRGGLAGSCRGASAWQDSFGIVLGERRGTGIGGDATRLALDWAFNMLGLHNVMLEAFAFNEQAQRAYERAGFREIGRRRGSVRSLGRRWDSVLMDATADDLEGSVLARLRPEG
ncbi:MAG: GNAT family N-acetyltransferase, partial [Candidatus Rokuibacteriota bacterium]